MRVLLVEDEPKLRLALKKGLEQENFAVDGEETAEGGLGMAMTQDYDVIILDRMLPGGLDGLEVVKRLRAKGQKVPVIFLTARDEVKDRVEGLSAGADDYLVKPFAFEELLARVRALLRRPPQGGETVLRCADLTLDPIGFTVERAGKPIELTSKEFALLEYLLRHTGRVLGKDNIIQHVWDYDADILPNTVEVYMGYLRQKIDKPFKTKLLHTRHGFGYYVGLK
ncbi:MAG TPA: response regulator transcription factor [Candidatus Saccharimonadales bacterium]|nr:response regulator transcription factor [Candidatus Saccharimonadales bacterium]